MKDPNPTETERLESMSLQSSGDEDEPSFRQNEEATRQDWRNVINKVVPAVVVLRTTACRAFDTELPSSSHATGFVVDKRRGIILTNRHVVKPGPVVAQAIFVNHEEVPVHPIYRDPVHDFGFFRYDPSAIHFLDYEDIPLAPDAACVGLEIRVVGNDSREKVSILAGTLARLDRDAPTYKKDGYNDFNTFYIQAASGTKGGSSGSPVIDLQGRAVALNAGSKTTSSSAFFLPLERVVRALQLLQGGTDSYIKKWEAVSIPRGTLQVTFCYKGFDEIRRLGLQRETEQMIRRSSPSEKGMLVVDSVVPGSPAHKQLEPGDILVCMNGEVTTKFLKMETLIDDSVNQKIELLIERGGLSLNVKIEVQDLHSITPNRFLEVGGAVIHPLSYQQARNFRFHCGLVYVADPGYMLIRAGVPRHAIIKKFADVEISQLEEFISVLSKLSRGARVPLEYIVHKDRHRRKIVLLTMDRHEWYGTPKIYTRDDGSGLWIAESAIQANSLSLPSNEDVGQNLNNQTSQLCSKFIHMKLLTSQDHASEEAYIGKEYHVETNKQQVQGNAGLTKYEGSSVATSNASFAEHVIEQSLVILEVNVPPHWLVDGVPSQSSIGTGVIIHHSQDMGLVVVDRNTVATSVCDVMLSFAAFPIEIPGEVVFLHPFYNYAIVSYDPSALGAIGASRVCAAEILPEPALRRGDPVYLVGLNRSRRAISRKSVVTNSCLTLNIGSADTPCNRATNMEVIELDSDFGGTFTGVLCNEQGKVQALWSSFSLKSGSISSKDYGLVRGIPIYMIGLVLENVISSVNGRKRPMPLLRMLEVDLFPRLLSKARNFGMSEDWIQELVNKDPLRQQVLRVKCCFAGSKAENLLKQGDMLLAVNKEPVTCFRDIENVLEKCGDDDGKLNLTILREGSEIDVPIGTDIRDVNGTTRMINWSGCVIQAPHLAVRALGFLPEEGHGVYVATWCRGSPAQRYGLYGLRWIVEVNGKPTPDLDSFIDVAKELGPEEFVRVRTINLQGKPQVLTLKQDLHYWPTVELRFDSETGMWRRANIKTLDSGCV